MDVNKVVKLNNLAMQLERHNIVYSKEDAIRQAENVYGNQAVAHYSDQPSEPDEMRKDMRRISFGLRDAMVAITELKQQVAKLEKELNDARVNQLPPRQTAPQPAVVGQQKLQSEKPIDRNGIAPKDISIEKFFYFGEK